MCGPHTHSHSPTRTLSFFEECRDEILDSLVASCEVLELEAFEEGMDAIPQSFEDFLHFALLLDRFAVFRVPLKIGKIAGREYGQFLGLRGTFPTVANPGARVTVAGCGFGSDPGAL